MEDTSLNWPETRPEIVGPRLFLREPKHADAHAIADMFGDFDIARMTGSIPAIYHPHAANGWISCSLGGFARQRRIDWMILENDTRRVVGTIGLFKRRGGSHWEIGYSLRRSTWGRGYATEAAQIVMDWARDTLGVDTIVAGHFEDNPASGRVLEKLGFVRYGDAEMMYSLARGEKSPGYRYIWPADQIANAPQRPLH